MPHESGLTCIHMPEPGEGLCPDCEEEYAEDPEAWHEFGSHSAGMARWAELEADLANRHEADPLDVGFTDSDIPF